MVRTKHVLTASTKDTGMTLILAGREVHSSNNNRYVHVSLILANTRE
jgi:hypothetical protein